MIAEVAARLCDAPPGSGLKSQARRMLRMGTTVPPLALAGTASATAGFNADAATRTAGKARRVSVEIVNDILSIVLSG
jgi:hypothetical protein